MAEIERYQARIEALKQEIAGQEDKIKAAINRVWGKAEGRANNGVGIRSEERSY